MKILIKLLFAQLVVVSIASCELPNRTDDSVAIAKEINDDTIDDHDVEKDADFVVITIADSYGEIKLAALQIMQP